MADLKFHLSSSPHFSEGLSTKKIMAVVLIALLPEICAGVYFFGIPALITILVSVAGCILFEALFQIVSKQKVRVNNLSAAVSGVMLALVLPSTTPLWMVLIGDFIAMVVAKGLFGGIGSNVFNPALTGRAVLFISFPAALGACWAEPKMDAVSSATTLSAIKSGNALDIDWMQYFLGNRAGCIGETSIALILISFAFLALIKLIDWRAPFAMVGTVAVCTFISSLSNGIQAAAADVVIALLTGGLIFGATFMITDYATSPVTGNGRLVFGFGAGMITFLIRKFGGYPEGVMFSILIMNAFAPFLNNLSRRMYGYGKKGNRRADTSKINMEFDLSNSVLRTSCIQETDSKSASTENSMKEVK